uniref:Uncharacterized protein n=1 Tax=Rhizophora mucronata TaxID=61149 RepID=A0A2P2QG20_RHIMU
MLTAVMFSGIKLCIMLFVA